MLLPEEGLLLLVRLVLLLRLLLLPEEGVLLLVRLVLLRPLPVPLLLRMLRLQCHEIIVGILELLLQLLLLLLLILDRLRDQRQVGRLLLLLVDRLRDVGLGVRVGDEIIAYEGHASFGISHATPLRAPRPRRSQGCRVHPEWLCSFIADGFFAPRCQLRVDRGLHLVAALLQRLSLLSPHLVLHYQRRHLHLPLVNERHFLLLGSLRTCCLRAGRPRLGTV